MKRDGIFKYRADLRPVASIVIIFLLSLVPFVFHMAWWVLVPYGLVVWYLRSYGPYAQHNHAHLPTFHSKFLNWTYDLVLTQCTGYVTAVWELHHVRGHHRHFLTPEQDVARLTSLKTGKLMPRWHYALRGNMTILKDSIVIGIGEGQEGRKSLLPKLGFEIGAQLMITSALFIWNPWLATGLFILPNLALSWAVWWESYQHHLEVPLGSAYDGSVTITDPWFNFQTFNIGHHTAHHEKPTLHWSLLPKRTEAILEKIPPSCLQKQYRFSTRRPAASPASLQAEL